MKYPVTYHYHRNGNFLNTDPDYDDLHDKLHKFFKDNHIQFRFVPEHGLRGDYQFNQPFWNITRDTLYFYRTQDRNLFLLHFGELYSAR